MATEKMELTNLQATLQKQTFDGLLIVKPFWKTSKYGLKLMRNSMPKTEPSEFGKFKEALVILESETAIVQHGRRGSRGHLL